MGVEDWAQQEQNYEEDQQNETGLDLVLLFNELQRLQLIEGLEFQRVDKLVHVFHH